MPIVNWTAKFQLELALTLEFGWIGKIRVGLDWQLVGKIEIFLPIVQPWYLLQLKLPTHYNL